MLGLKQFFAKKSDAPVDEAAEAPKKPCPVETVAEGFRQFEAIMGTVCDEIEKATRFREGKMDEAEVRTFMAESGVPQQTIDRYVAGMGKGPA